MNAEHTHQPEPQPPTPGKGEEDTSAERLRLVLESIQDYAIFTITTDNRIDSWNAGAAHIMGYDDQEIIGQDGSIIFTPEDRAAGQVEAELRTARDTGRSEDERWHLRKDGSRFYASGVMHAMYDAHGVLRGYVKVMRDLTERQQAQEALQASEEQYRLLIESLHDYALFTLDTEGRVSSWNTGAQRLKGYTAEEIIGQPFARFFTPEDWLAGLPVREMQIAQLQGRVEQEGWRVHKDGHLFWSNEVMTPLRARDGRLLGFTKISRDLTERKRAEEALRESHELLEQRVQERTEQLAVAHTQLQTVLRQLVTAQEEERRRIARELHDQLGQSLTALRVGLATLSQIALPPAAALVVSDLQQQTGQIDEELDRLIVELRPSVLDDLGLLAAIEAHVARWSSQYGVEVELQTTGFETLAVPPVSATVFYRVFQEALTNIVKHAQAQHVSVVLNLYANQLQLIIEDNGRGFDAEAVLQAVGNGKFGLLGMRERVAAVGGSVSIESTPGQGTTVYVRIPFTRNE